MPKTLFNKSVDETADKFSLIRHILEQFQADKSFEKIEFNAKEIIKFAMQNLDDIESQGSDDFETRLRFVKDRVINGISRFSDAFELMVKKGFAQPLLGTVGLELTPDIVGKTKVDSRTHDIQDSRRKESGKAGGSVAEIHVPGLRDLSTGDIIQKAVVSRFEDGGICR